MKITYTSIEDFINEEIKEHGFDYVDAMFAAGYEPALMPGNFYSWVKSEAIDNALQPTICTNVGSHTLSCDVSNSRRDMVGGLMQLSPVNWA